MNRGALAACFLALAVMLCAAPPAAAQDKGLIGRLLQQLGSASERAKALEAEARYPQAEPYWRELIRVQRQLSVATEMLGADVRDEGMNSLAQAQRSLAFNLMEQQRNEESLSQWQEALATTKQWVASGRPGADLTARATTFGGVYINMAQIYGRLGRAREDEDSMRTSIDVLEGALARAPNPETAKVLAIALYNRGSSLVNGRAAEAEPLLARALSLREHALGPEHPTTQNTRMNLAAAYRALGRDGEAEALHRQLAEAWERSKGPLHGDTVFALEMVATDRTRRGDLSGAEKILRETLSRYGRMSPVDLGWQAGGKYALAHLLARLGRNEEALQLADQAASQLQTLYGTSSPQAGNALQLAGQLHLNTQDAGGAVQRLRPACQAFGDIERRQERSASVGAEWDFSAARRSRCATVLTAALASWAAGGGGASAEDRPASLQQEAWLAAQDAQISSAGTALSRSGARRVAGASGVGDAAEQYERALEDVQKAERAWAEMQRPGKATSPVQSQEGLRSTGLARERQRLAAQQLQTRAPAYWALRSPRPVPVSELHGGGGTALLAEDELLLLWLQSTELSHGVVLAVSAHEMAVARIGLRTVEVDALVRRLREQIDPCAWGVAGAQCERPDTGEQRAFDTKAASDLYQALLGDASIARLINAPSIKTVLVVPSGSLTSLPPGLLISQPSQQGVPLAQQAWLLRDKAVAVLPTVAALRTLRQGVAGPSGSGTLPLFMMANPDFSGRGMPGPVASKRAVPRAAAQYLADGSDGGKSRADALAQLPPLPGTATEAALLGKLLGARDSDVLVGSPAREAVMRERGQALSRARVVAFATHGLVAGDLGSAEPGLALGAPLKAEAQAGDDGVLSASKVAQLRLTADWVLLSACNTAAPDANNAQGLSGLARAFFYAGARAMLVSHWRVDDEATQALITRTISAHQANPGMGRAQALRQASLAVMRGEGLSAQGLQPSELEDLQARRAHPAAWAPFILVGEPH